MRTQSPFSAQVIGVGAAVPPTVMLNQEIVDRLSRSGLETSDSWIQERTGIRERRISRAQHPKEQNSQLALQATLAALEMAHRKAEDIDAIFYGTTTPDTIIPSSACWLQHGLGNKKAFAVDLNAACSGFVYALNIADHFIRGGQSKLALVVGADVLSPITNWQDRSSCILFGDGAGVCLIERVAADHPRRILWSHLQSDGSLWDHFYVPVGGSSEPLNPENYSRNDHTMKMKGKEIFKVAVKTLADFAVRALAENGLKIQDLDWLVPHQANARIIEAVAKRLDFPMNKVVMNIDRFGNTSAGTVPIALNEAVRDGRIQPGHLVLMDVFGAGLTFGATLLRW